MFWLGAIVSLCYVPGMTGAYIATQWPVLAVLLPLALLREGPVTAFHWLGTLFLAYAAARAWYSPAAQTGVFGFWLLCIMGLCLWLGTTLKSPRKIYAGLAAGAAVSSALAVFQHFGFSPLPTVSDNPAGLYVNSVQQGVVLALIAVALASERMWFWALPLLPGIALSGSRGAWLALGVGLLGCYVRRVWVLGLAAGAIAAYLLVLPHGKSDQVRTLIWETTWDNLTLFGYGPGVFFNLVMSRDGVTFFPEYAHNDALQLLFEHGIGAALPFAIFAFVLRRTEAREWPIVLSFVAAGFCTMPLWMPVASFLAFVAVGRVLREYALDGAHSSSGRHPFLPWRRGRTQNSGGAVPVASYY